MSIRTIFEINHDQAHKIDNAPQDFIDALMAFAASNSDRNADRLKHFGITVIGSRHHTEKVEVTYDHTASPIIRCK